jgi:hypothetical protein
MSFLGWLKNLFAGEKKYSFEAPRGWSVETLEDGSRLIMCPAEEAGWVANMHFEIRKDNGGRGLRTCIDDLIPNLAKQKANFKLLQKTILTHPKGFKYGLVEYQHDNGETALTDWEVLMPMGGNYLLFALASTASSLTEKYHPVFKEVLATVSIG